ncbi:MAG: hypothetical protein H8E01_00435 [Chloroflexi bacterium]|nr:hypothetical protein [Chloroflexota bacterium]
MGVMSQAIVFPLAGVGLAVASVAATLSDSTGMSQNVVGVTISIPDTRVRELQAQAYVADTQMATVVEVVGGAKEGFSTLEQGEEEATVHQAAMDRMNLAMADRPPGLPIYRLWCLVAEEVEGKKSTLIRLAAEAPVVGLLRSSPTT